MAPPPSPWGAAGGGFGGANMMRPAVMPEGWNRPVPAVMPGGGDWGTPKQAVMPQEYNDTNYRPPGIGMATGGGYGPGALVRQPGGPINQFGGFQGGAQQFGPNSGLLGNIMGGAMAGGMGQPGMPPGQPQQAVMPPMGQPGMGGGAMAGAPPMGQPGMVAPPAPGGGMAQPETPYDPGVSAGRLAEAQRLAGLGQMGRAKQQWELGGGDWGGQAHRFLRG